MSDFIWFIFSLSGAICAFVVSVTWLLIWPKSRIARRLSFLLVLAYALAATYGVSYNLGRVLTAGFRPFVVTDAPPGTTAIVVLGSGGFTARGYDDHELTNLDPMSASRVLEAVRVFGLTQADWVISSGGAADELHEASGWTMGEALETLGVPRERIRMELESTTTHDEAVLIAPMLRSLKVKHAILVTSPIHMRRALGTFHIEGIEAIPAMARDPFMASKPPLWFPPSAIGLQQSALLAHEMLGIAYYGVRGWFVFT